MFFSTEWIVFAACEIFYCFVADDKWRAIHHCSQHKTKRCLKCIACVCRLDNVAEWMFCRKFKKTEVCNSILLYFFVMLIPSYLFVHRYDHQHQELQIDYACSTLQFLVPISLLNSLDLLAYHFIIQAFLRFHWPIYFK